MLQLPIWYILIDVFIGIIEDSHAAARKNIMRICVHFTQFAPIIIFIKLQYNNHSEDIESDTVY